MRSLLHILALLLFSSISLAQNDPQETRAQLDSLRQVVLGPKLERYGQRVEKFTRLIKNTQDKRCVKQYARQLAQVSETFGDDIAALYDCGIARNRGGVYVGVGMGPWFYPGFGGYWYGYPYDRFNDFGYDCLPQVFYDIDKIRQYASSIRFRSSSSNVTRKLALIHEKMEDLKKAVNAKPGEAPVSVK